MAESKQPNPQLPDSPHALSASEILKRLDVDPDTGLGRHEAHRRHHRFGPNRLQEVQQRGAGAILIDQFKSVVVLVLGAAAILALALGEWVEAGAVAAVILVNTAIGFVSEWRATGSMEALRRLQQPRTRVRREGKEFRIPSEQLVPGDIVLLEGGDAVPADLRLVEANNLRVDESALTGESVTVNKTVDPVDADAALADRHCLLFSGTTLTEGSARGVVTATGMASQLGRIAALAESAGGEITPLEKRLNTLGRRLVWVVIGVAVIVAVSGLMAGQPVDLMIETAVALGVAAVPEGLPIVATIALARGMWRMARHQALINRLAAVETLGATGVIFTDKTGTLTENRMRLQRVLTESADLEIEDGRFRETATDEWREGDPDPQLRTILETGILCSNAHLPRDDRGEAQGDPTELALLRAGADFGLHRETLLEERPEIREIAFDADVMMMATIHETGDGFEVRVKGAPDAVLQACERVAVAEDEDRELDDPARESWQEAVRELAQSGLRVLAMADKRISDPEAPPYESLRLQGLIGLLDPPREGVREAIRSCNAAGIRVVMVTGDQPETAAAIAREVGLTDEAHPGVLLGQELIDLDDADESRRQTVLDTPVFARVSPEQKLDLIRLFQGANQTVAMTGDGVNDAPALKKADIGVAMGKRGTDAARQASDMVLRDDAFASIVEAVHQGRVIFANIRKSVMFMLCTNVAEILAVAAASLAGAPLPLLPLQILYLNVVTDVFPALALGVGRGSEKVMQQPPRDPREPVLTRQHWQAIGGWSTLVAITVLAALATAVFWLDYPTEQAVTVSFLTLAFAKLWFVLNLRDAGTRLHDNDIVRNPWIWAAIALCIPLLLLAVHFAPLAGVLKTVAPDATGWLVVLGLSTVPAMVGQLLLAGRRHADQAR